MTTDTNITPIFPIHPGELLKEELQSRHITQRRFAEIIDMPYTALNEIINGKRSVSAELAIMLEAALKIKAYIWVGLQSDYNLHVAIKTNANNSRLAHIRKICAML